MQLRRNILLGLSAATVFFAGIAIGAQPRMQSALTALGEAKGQLEKADHNKGGHRVRAIELINQAISEVQAGVAFAR